MNKLTTIGAEMKQQALANPGQAIRHTLPRGLHLVMRVRLPMFQLSCVRPGVYPSKREVEVIKRDFNVPSNAREEKRRDKHAGVTYHIIRLIWSEAEQMTLIPADELEPGEPANYYQGAA